MRNWYRRVALAGSIVVLIFALVAGTIVFHPDVRVATGDSMEPTITGPAVVHCPSGEYTASDIETGDIVVIQPEDPSEFVGLDNESGTIMHRVMFIDDDVSPANLKTQGDNEDSTDGYTGIENVRCVYESHVSLPV